MDDYNMDAPYLPVPTPSPDKTGSSHSTTTERDPAPTRTGDAGLVNVGHVIDKSEMSLLSVEISRAFMVDIFVYKRILNSTYIQLNISLQAFKLSETSL